MRVLRLQRFEMLPVLRDGPGVDALVSMLRKGGMVCLGPYHSDKWYIFWPKKG